MKHIWIYMTIAWMILCLLSQYNSYQKTKIIEMQEILNSKQTNVILLQDELISMQEKNLDIQNEIIIKLGGHFLYPLLQ